MHSQQEATRVLEPYVDLLAEPFPAAWSKWEQLGQEWPELHPHLSSRARATMISDWAVARTRTVLSGMEPKVKLVDAHGFLLIVLEDELYVRLKKFRNGKLRTCSIPTQQQLKFAAQDPIPGMPKATNLTLGYLLDPFQTRIERMAITCSTSGTLHWNIDVPLPGGAVVVQRPMAPEPNDPGIRSKRNEEDRKNEDS